MPQASLDTKRGYYARIRQANYAASLKLEGIELKSDAPEAFEQDKQTLLAHYRRLSKSQ